MKLSTEQVCTHKVVQVSVCCPQGDFSQRARRSEEGQSPPVTAPPRRAAASPALHPVDSMLGWGKEQKPKDSRVMSEQVVL
jgi:hypothetical protein